MVFTKQNSLYVHEGSLTPFAWDDSFRRNLDTKSNNLSIGHEWVRNRIKPSCCDLDKNLILFVTLWVGLCEDFHWRRILGQPLAVILLSFLPLSIIYTSQENSHLATVSVTVCVYVCLKCLVFFFHVWMQCTMHLFFCIAHWYGWPGVNESRSTGLQISKGDWEGLDTFVIWQHCLKAFWCKK